MRELIYAVGGLAGAAVIGAWAALGRPPAFWRPVLYVASLALCLCAIWLLIDFLAEDGFGMWIGLNWPIWARGLFGAVIGAAIWIGVTTLHSGAQGQNPSIAPPAQTAPPQGPHVIIEGTITNSGIDNIYVAPGANPTLEIRKPATISGAGRDNLHLGSPGEKE
ncbi:MAG: hypothetical protein ACLQJ0_08205 [Steroidobacteraceae bacterium]